MDNQKLVSILEKKGYRFVGRHSAIKICEWCRESVRGNNVCYKEKFYGISSHRCIQMSPAVFFCDHKCLFCWRSTPFLPKWSGVADEPTDIIDGCIEEQKKILQGFFGGECDKKKLREAMQPKHVAISLVGEPCLYPKLPQLIDEIKDRKMTAFLVSNGTQTAMIEQLLDSQPTNMYITLPAPDEKIYKKTCLPDKNSWNNLLRSLSLLKKFDRSVIRLTLAKGLNFIDAEGYAEIIEKASPDFIEVKAFMSVGGAREKIPYEDMPRHGEIKDFAEQIEKNSSYKIKNEKADSRVVLMGR